MFFQKADANNMKIEISGHTFEVSAGADSNHQKCKSLLLEIINKVIDKGLDDSFT